MRTSPTQVIASLVPCVMLTRDGQQCGKDGQEGLPAGVCPGHAVEIYRAVARLVDAKRAEEAAR